MNALGPALWAAMLAAATAPAARIPATRAPAARAPIPVIAVVAPPGGDPAVTEALSRFKGEAASVGFEVTVVAGSASGTPLAQMEEAARAASAVATVAFVNGGDPHAFDVWFTDRLTGKTVLGHVAVENQAGDRASVVLAVKAVDFLRARMFDFLVARPAAMADGQTAPASLAPATEPATPATTATAPASPTAAATGTATTSTPADTLPPATAVASVDSYGWALSLGVVAFKSLQGLGTTVAPVLRAAHELSPWSSLRIVVAGFGTGARLDGMNGSATFTESLAEGELVVTPTSTRVHPIFAIGVGIHDVRAQGTATAPYTARTASRVSAAVSLSAGAGMTLTPRLALEAEGGPFLLFPEPQVRIAGLDGGRTGRPGLSATVTMKARF